MSQKQTVAQALHEAACDPAGDVCSWAGEDYTKATCRVFGLKGRWRETGLEDRIIASMTAHGLLVEATEDIEKNTCKGCGASFDRPAGPGCPMPVQHIMPVRSGMLG